MANEGFSFTVEATDGVTPRLQKMMSEAQRFAQQMKTRLKVDAPQPAQAAQVAGLAGHLKGVGQAFEPVEKLGKIFTGVQAAAVAFKGVTAALKGDWDGVNEAVQQLPFGIGQLSKFAADFRAEVTGAKAELEELNDRAARMDRDTAVAQARNTAFRAAMDRLRARALTEQRGTQLTGITSQSAKIRQQLKFDIEDVNTELERLLKEQEKLGAGPASRAAQQLREQAARIKAALTARGLAEAAEASHKETAERIRRAYQPLVGHFQRFGDAMKSAFTGAGNTAAAVADQMRDRLSRAVDRVRELTAATDAARDAFRGVAADRDRRAFELALAGAGGDVNKQRALTIQRAERLRQEAAGRFTEPEAAAAKLDEAIGLVTNLVKEALREGQRAGGLRDLLTALENQREALAANRLAAAGRAELQGQKATNDARRGLRAAQFAQAAGELETGARAARDLFVEGGRAFLNLIKSGTPRQQPAAQARVNPWGAVGPMGMGMMQLENANRMLLGEVGR